MTPFCLEWVNPASCWLLHRGINDDRVGSKLFDCLRKITESPTVIDARELGIQDYFNRVTAKKGTAKKFTIP